MKLSQFLLLSGALAIGAFSSSGCNAPHDRWVKSPGLQISVQKDYNDGKPYLTVFYENFGTDTIRRIRYQLISETKGKVDTEMREIDPPMLLRPTDRHMVPHVTGEDTLAADQVSVGQVWVVRDTK